jgi:hypothetical protein
MCESPPVRDCVVVPNDLSLGIITIILIKIIL